MKLKPEQIRGFNYQPGYSSQLQYTWTNFDRASWEREVPYALRFGSNTLRVWLDWSAYLAMGSKFFDRIEEAIEILDANGLLMMPVLFNRWTDIDWPAGGITNDHLAIVAHDFLTFKPYVDGLMDRFANDRRIVMWDLCNEPTAPRGEVAEVETAWLQQIGLWLRERTELPITIGTATGDNVRQFAPFADVLSFHPYARVTQAQAAQPGERRACMKALCEKHLEIAREFGKPLICTETCVGSLNDLERGELARDNLETLDSFGIGWVAWHLVAGEFVSAHPQKVDSNSVRRHEGYMPFVLTDGSTRPGHEWLETNGG